MATTKHILERPEPDAGRPISVDPPLGLMSRVSALACRRRAAAYNKADAEQTAKRAVVLAAECADEEKLSAKVKECITEEVAKYIRIGEHIRASNARIEARENHSRSLHGRTDAEIERLMESAIDAEIQVGLQQRKDEDAEQFSKRILMLEQALAGLTLLLNSRKALQRVRYLDGHPVNMVGWQPKFMPPEQPRFSRTGKCLQCRAKRIRCSHARVSFRRWDYEHACTRCRMHGDPCMIKDPDDPDEDDSYDFADPEMKVPEEGERRAALAKELMDSRRRDGVIKPFPAWHSNDNPDNKTDWTFNPKTWADVLEDRPTKWLTWPSDTTQTDQEEDCEEESQQVEYQEVKCQEEESP
ncbi:hypothetical protein AK830_g9760 [Neonectria ditissima]|uniref:Zn(2)-C6 fungal-type domain-containing protein n=1 Tax=Neonectria ditissima TaxID=78410 RepID=A0A0P7B8U8_9HYPO|nr:hypothetical protein AK830_g9760 [Neonectria ditissima]